jgi:RimJ/RimL family protein N-acetyltransferase
MDPAMSMIAPSLNYDYSGGAFLGEAPPHPVPLERLPQFTPLRFGEFTVALLSEEYNDVFVEAVAFEIGKRYPETGECYAREILVSATENEIFGAGTSLCKLILGCYLSRQLVGFTVVTSKYGRRIKFGPTVVLPHARGQGIARLLRQAGESHFGRFGFRHAFSTCREDNAAARAYVIKSGYRLVGRLVGQYSPGIVELVYAKRLFEYSGSFLRLAQNPGKAKEHIKFYLRRKRGGAAKIELPHSALRSAREFTGSLEHAIYAAKSEGIRRVYLKIPADPALCNLAGRFALRLEGLGLPDYLSQHEVLLARIIEQ